MAVGIEKRRDAVMGDPGNIVNIVSWLLLVVSVGVVVARFCMKLSIKDRSKRYGLDDLFILFAALFGIGHTISTSIESFHSLGQPKELLTSSQLEIFQKTEYAGYILYIANMGCARISLCFLIKKVLPGTIPRTVAYVFGCFTSIWMILGIFITAFHCSLPNTWRFVGNNNCFDIVRWVNYIGITNIVVEPLLISIPLLVWNLRTSAGKRLSVSLLFMTRLSIVATVSVQLYFFNRSTLNLAQYWHSILCVQVAQNLSIITACLPILHPFIVKILSGVVQTENIRWRCSEIKDCFKFRKNNPEGDREPPAEIINYDRMSSQSSGLLADGTMEKNQAMDYCRPLATYGLDRASANVNINSNQYTLFPSPNTARPMSSSTSPPDSPPPKDIFMAPVPIPSYSRPSTSHSQTSRKTSFSRSNSLRATSLSHKSKSRRPSQTPSEPPQVPQSLSEVGVLPIIDWDTESSADSSGRSTPSRRPNSTYIFNRSKVISVPEESHLRDGADQDQYYKKYYPPLPSPKTPKRPPRNF